MSMRRRLTMPAHMQKKYVVRALDPLADPPSSVKQNR